MRRFTWIVMTNCDPAHEAQFNTWYDEVHLKDLQRIPGVRSARRSKLSNVQMAMREGSLQLCGATEIGAKFNYLAIYDIETDDVTGVLQEVKARSNTSAMVISPHMTEAYTMMFEAIS